MPDILNLLRAKVISHVPHREIGEGHYSHLFLVKKPSGKHRIIINLKPLNQGVCIIPYLDDFLIIAPSASRLNQDVTRVLDILGSLGWIPNLEKSDLQPSPRKKFLGILLDSEKRMSFLPKDRQTDLVRRISRGGVEGGQRNNKQSWIDEFISWNPDVFCGLKKMFVLSDYFWTPDLYIYEMIESDDNSPNIPYYRISYNGKIVNAMPMRIVVSCKLNIFTFPFDNQTCTLSFGYLFGYMTEAIVYNAVFYCPTLGCTTLNAYWMKLICCHVGLSKMEKTEKVKDCIPKKVSFSDIFKLPKSKSSVVNKNAWDVFTSKGDWVLEAVTVQEKSFVTEGEEYNQVIYSIYISRTPMIYILNLIIPACFLVFLDIVSMFIQSFSERLGFKITIVLGFSVLLLILNDMLPSSDNTPMLGIFCCICMAMMALSILGTITTLYMLEKSNSSAILPLWIKKVVFTYLAQILCFKKTIRAELVTLVTVDNGVKIRDELNFAKKEKEAKSEWMILAQIVDRLVLVLYLITVSLVFTIMICVWTLW
ncbi:5-hydroxytryptamine receptor 3A-like [Ranitomeya variabilis]|uniref:5-hydroxytryptamine receptor 3A-like n=1 Tax=Ranitomeya variabilis TaxID=490064 RepID=UPI004055B43A